MWVLGSGCHACSGVLGPGCPVSGVSWSRFYMSAGVLGSDCDVSEGPGFWLSRVRRFSGSCHVSEFSVQVSCAEGSKFWRVLVVVSLCSNVLAGS